MGTKQIRHWAIAAAAGAATVLVALSSGMGGDYPGPPCRGCDYAGPPIDALVHLDIGRFFATQPLMGGFSLVLRLPSALLTEATAKGSLLWQYRLGALVCLLGPLWLALGLRRLMERRGAGLVAQAVVVAICVANPLTFAALHWGHPEEPLAGALCVGAVLLAGERRPIHAGLALGLAFATKPWAWLALAPVLLAGRERRRETLGVALAVGAAFTLPMLLGDPSRFLHQVGGMGVSGSGVTPFNIWWGYASQGGGVVSGGASAPTYVIPATLGALAHPLVIAVALCASVLFWRRHPSPRPARALQLLALLFLIRCLLDPLAISYHHVPFLLALVAAEASGRQRVPQLSLAVVAISWVMTKFLTPYGPDVLSRVYLSWALPIALYLVYSLFVRSRLASRSATRPRLESV